VKEFNFFLNKGPGHLQRGDNHKNVKIGWGHLKNFSRTIGPILTRLGTNHFWLKGIQFCSKEGDSSSPRGDNSKRVKKTLTIFKNLLLQNQQAKFNQTWYKLSLGMCWVKGIQVCSNKGPGRLQRGDNHNSVKIGWSHLKILFSRTTGPILTRLGTKHPCLKGIQVCSKEWDSPSPRGDNSERVKMHWKFLRIFFSRTSRPKSIKLGTNYPLVERTQIKGQALFKGR
jgi:hypothetical protein